MAYRLSAFFALVSFVLGLLVLIGWEAGMNSLTTMWGVSHFMAPNTALLLMVGAVAVALAQPSVRSRLNIAVVRILGLLLFAFALLTCLEYALGVDFGIDQLMFRSYVADWTITSTPGRFAIQTALTFTLLGAAFLFIDRRIGRFELCEVLSAGALLICFLGVVGHAYGVKSLYGLMALHTAIACGSLSLGTLLTRPDTGIVAMFFSSDAGGVALRRMLLSTIFALTVFGWVRLHLQKSGFVSLEGGTALLVLVSLLFVCVLLIRTSFALDAIEREREATRRALLESEAKYRSLFENTKEGIALYEPVLDAAGQPEDWIIRDANPMFIGGAGRSREEIVGRRLTEVFGSREAMSTYFQAATEVFNTGRARQFESYFAPLNRHYIASVFPIQGTLYASTTIDITKIKLADQQVRESEARYRQIVETASEGIWLLDQNMQITFVNDRCAEMLGYRPEEIIGQRKFDFVFPEDAAFVQSMFDDRRRGVASHVDLRMRHRDGSERWMMISAAPLFDSKGSFRGALDMFTDITDRRATVQALRESEERFRQLADSMPQMVWTAQPDGTIDYCNQRWIEYTGLAPRRTQAWEWSDIVHPSDAPLVLERWRFAVTSGQEYVAEARMRRDSDATYRWHLTRAFPAFDAHGKVVRWYGTCTDIHDSKIAEEAMMKSEKLAATGRLAATIAHEINNPLEAVTNLIFLAQNAANPDQGRDYLNMASDELQRVAHITKQTLGFYRETAALAPVRIGGLLDSVLALYERRIESKEIRVLKRYTSDAQIEAIPGEIRQVISNLISNALDALEPKGSLQLRVRAVSEGAGLRQGVRIVVADDGTGVPEEIRQQIFEPFFTTKRDFGTGLGLWVTRQIVRRHGGYIRIRSCTSGQRRGTYFSVFLPSRAVLEEMDSWKVARA